MNKRFKKLFFVAIVAIVSFLIALLVDYYFHKTKTDNNICYPPEKSMIIYHPSHPFIQYSGRFNFISDKQLFFTHSGCKITVRFKGNRIFLLLKNYSTETRFFHSNYFNVFIDSLPPILLHATNDSFLYRIENLSDGIHTMTLFKRTEAACGLIEFNGILLDSFSTLLKPPAKPKLKIEFVGNSITAGYGNEDTLNSRKFKPVNENHYFAYPAICARLLNAEFHSVCYSGKGVFRNYDKSTTETLPILYTKIYPQKKNHWNFNSWQPDIIVVNAGTNDFGLGIPPADSFIIAFTHFLIKIRKLNPNSKIIIVDGPLLKDGLKTDSLTGAAVKTYSIYINYLKQAISNYKRAGYSNIYSFSFSPIGSLGYGTNWHPSVAQHEKNAEELVGFIKKLMEK